MENLIKSKTKKGKIAKIAVITLVLGVLISSIASALTYNFTFDIVVATSQDTLFYAGQGSGSIDVWARTYNRSTNLESPYTGKYHVEVRRKNLLQTKIYTSPSYYADGSSHFSGLSFPASDNYFVRVIVDNITSGDIISGSGVVKQ